MPTFTADLEENPETAGPHPLDGAGAKSLWDLHVLPRVSACSLPRSQVPTPKVLLAEPAHRTQIYKALSHPHLPHPRVCHSLTSIPPNLLSTERDQRCSEKQN